MSLLIMSIYEKPKPTSNIILNGEWLEASLLRQERDKDVFSPFVLNIVLEVLATAIRQEKE